MPRKAAHCLRREVGQNIKDKKRDKRVREGEPSREGTRNRGSFQIPGSPLTGGSGGSFRISEGNLTGRKNKYNPQITCLKPTPSRKVPQTLASTTNKLGLNREEQAALLRNKGRTEKSQRGASWRRTGPSPAGGRRQRGGERGKRPQRWHSLPNCKQDSSF